MVEVEYSSASGDADLVEGVAGELAQVYNSLTNLVLACKRVEIGPDRVGSLTYFIWNELFVPR